MALLKVSDEELHKVIMVLRHPAVDVLMGVLRNPREDVQVRNAAAGALETIGGSVVVNKLIEAMCEAKATDWLTVFSLAALFNALQDRDSVLRSRAAVALGRLGDERAFETLVIALRDPKVHVRRDAMWALSELGDRRAAGLLIRALRDPSRFIRMQAAERLGEMGSSQMLPELQRLVVHEKQRRVKQAAWQAISLLERQA